MEDRNTIDPFNEEIWSEEEGFAFVPYEKKLTGIIYVPYIFVQSEPTIIESSSYDIKILKSKYSTTSTINNYLTTKI